MELVKSFETQLKQRLAQKTTQHTSEETMLTRTFRYFDLNNNGTVSKQEFSRALEKLGVWLNGPQDVETLFRHYDKDGNQALDYNEFIAQLYNLKSSRVVSARSPAPQMGQVQECLARLKAQLRARGGKTILGLGRQFRIMDDNGNRRLEREEFAKAMHDYGVGLSSTEVQSLFGYFDRNQDGQISYDEFLLSCRDPMNEYRMRFVGQAYCKLDKNGDGRVQVDDLIDVYNVEKHPDYLQGKKTKEQVLTEFMGTFEQYSDLKGLGDGVITKEEFTDYYSFISASIDNDQYFELMMNNCWRINEGNNDTWNKKGWSNQAPEKKQENKQESTLQSAYQANQLRARRDDAPFGTSTNKQARQAALNPQQSQQHGQQLLKVLRKKIASRGANGIYSLGRLFRNIDDNRSRALEMNEFQKCLREFRLGLSHDDVACVYGLFDKDANGKVSYDEFLRGVRGQMNPARVKVVRQAFNKLDSDKSGIVDITDIKTYYNAKQHPEVRQGKKTEEEVLGEFLDTFEQHHAMMVPQIQRDKQQNGKGRDGRVSFEEFTEYYNNISCSIDNDEYFDLMVKNAWQLDGHNKAYGRGWANQL